MKYKYFYEEYKPEDVIEAYEYPFEIKFKKKKDESVWKKDKGDYYYINEFHTFKKALDELDRISNKEKNDLIQETINFIPMDYKTIANGSDISSKIQEREKIMDKLMNNSCINCKNFYKHYIQCEKFYELKAQKEALEGELNPENLEHYKEFNTRENILQELKYVNDDNSLTLKGKAAREIGTTDCVLITELLTSDILNSLSDENVVGFISGFASNKNEIELDEPNISREFSSAVKKFDEIYKHVYNTEKLYNFEENKYNRRMTFEYSEAMKNWMQGKDFLEILNLTELEEGKLYNLIMRIFLMLEEISNFYSILGNVEQSKRFLEIKAKLMRGIMSLQSLYLQDKIDIDSIGLKKLKK